MLLFEGADWALAFVDDGLGLVIGVGCVVGVNGFHIALPPSAVLLTSCLRPLAN